MDVQAGEQWKTAVRVLHHELNNSLAPMLSLARTGRVLLDRPQGTERVGRVLDTIAERAEHLSRFLEGFATIARLPPPRLRRTTWKPLLDRLSLLIPFTPQVTPGDLSSDIDPGQIEQLLINLVKNAREAGSPREAITIDVRVEAAGVRLAVRDGGPGMPAAELARALRRQHSHKPGGSGLGLALCREIAEGHGGRLTLGNHAGGGLEVNLWLPSQGRSSPRSSGHAAT